MIPSCCCHGNTEMCLDSLAEGESLLWNPPSLLISLGGFLNNMRVFYFASCSFKVLLLRVYIFLHFSVKIGGRYFCLLNQCSVYFLFYKLLYLHKSSTTQFLSPIPTVLVYRLELSLEVWLSHWARPNLLL